jgi:hypothetical protein
MSQGTFKKVGESTERMYGPRALLVCGFTADEQQDFMAMLTGLRLTDVAVVFTVSADGTVILRDLFHRPDQSGRGETADFSRAVILSGVAENELHQILAAYRAGGLPRPLWATLTPYSEEWPLSQLLEELNAERAAENREKG